MSIIDNVRIKQDWSEEGYQFEKDATEEQKAATDEHGFFVGGSVCIDYDSIDAISGRKWPDFEGAFKRAIHRTPPCSEERKKALDQAKKFLDRMNSGSSFDGEQVRPASSLLDMDYNEGLSSWSHSRIITYEIEKRAAEHYNFVGEKIYGEE